MAQSNSAEFRRKLREAERKAQRELRREVDRVDRENQRRIDAFNREQQRKVAAHNRQVQQHSEREVREYNQDVAKVNAHDQRANRQNAATIAELNRRLRTTGPVRYTEAEQALADRVQEAVSRQDDREYDVFLSYARIDGSEAAGALKDALGIWTCGFGSTR